MFWSQLSGIFGELASLLRCAAYVSACFREGGDHWGDLGIDGWIILGQI